MGAQENDDGGTTDRPEEETAGLLQSPVEEVGHGLPTEGVVQRSTASGHGTHILATDCTHMIICLYIVCAICGSYTSSDNYTG